MSLHDLAARVLTALDPEPAHGLAIAALDGTGAQVVVSGRAVKQSAYDVQAQTWSKAIIPTLLQE